MALVTRQFSLQLSRGLRLELQLRLNLVSTPTRTQLLRKQGIDFSNVESAQARGVIPTGRSALKPIATHDNVVESRHRRQQAGGECVDRRAAKASLLLCADCSRAQVPSAKGEDRLVPPTISSWPRIYLRAARELEWPVPALRGIPHGEDAKRATVPAQSGDDPIARRENTGDRCECRTSCA